MEAEVVSSTSPFRQMMRSLRRREKMSSGFDYLLERGVLRLQLRGWAEVTGVPAASL